MSPKAYLNRKKCSLPEANTTLTVWTSHAVGSFGSRTLLLRNKCSNAASFTINLSHFILIKTSCEDIIEHGYSSTGGLFEPMVRESTVTSNYSIETTFINVIVCFQLISDNRSIPLRNPHHNMPTSFNYLGHLQKLIKYIEGKEWWFHQNLIVCLKAKETRMTKNLDGIWSVVSRYKLGQFFSLGELNLHTNNNHTEIRPINYLFLYFGSVRE